MTRVFPFVLKTAKVVLLYKKDSKLDYNNNRPTSLLSNAEKKYLKNVCIKDCIPFSIIIIISITYSLDSDNNILHRKPYLM